jgi:hypothetical protein
MRRWGWLVALLVLMASWGAAQVRAFVARSPADLPSSRRVGGRVGDFVLQNERLVFVITAADHVHRSAASGGNLVDAALIGAKKRGADELDQVTLFLGRYPRQGRYTSVRIVKDGSDGVAEVVAEGTDSEDSSLRLVTVYRLEAGKPFLLLRTTVTNTADKPLERFDFGDAIQWGNARTFAPLFGFGIQRRTETLDWVGAEGYGIAYGWCTAKGNNRIINGLGWSDPIALTADLPPKSSLTYERYFIVAATLAEVARIAWSLQGKPLHQVQGVVQSRATGQACHRHPRDGDGAENCQARSARTVDGDDANGRQGAIRFLAARWHLSVAGFASRKVDAERSDRSVADAETESGCFARQRGGHRSV